VVDTSELVQRAYAAFDRDTIALPPLTLRGGNAVDGYGRAEPFDPDQDAPSDTYFEQFTFWGLGYLDSRSWRHYLPRLIDYALRRPEDPAMVTEALVRSLSPPDRYPPRLATLTPQQEDVVRSFLELVALGDLVPHVQEEAQKALEEWWLPNPRSRPTADEIAALRAAPITYRTVVRDVYQLEMPDTLMGSGLRDIPEESRRVETWGGYLCGDVHTMVAVNVTPLEFRSLTESVRARSTLFRDSVSARQVPVRGCQHAHRMDGMTHGDSPAEPEALTLLFATAGPELVTLSIRTWTRDDVQREVERIIERFAIVAG